MLEKLKVAGENEELRELYALKENQKTREKEENGLKEVT